jgi:hypothetical protein
MHLAWKRQLNLWNWKAQSWWWLNVVFRLIKNSWHHKFSNIWNEEGNVFGYMYTIHPYSFFVSWLSNLGGFYNFIISVISSKLKASKNSLWNIVYPKNWLFSFFLCKSFPESEVMTNWQWVENIFVTFNKFFLAPLQNK